jgi:MFS family permease
MDASGTGQQRVSASGWNARLYWLWILYNSVAFVTVLTVSWVLVLVGSDVLHLSFSNHHTVWALVIATLGAVLFGGVLGVLQWLVVRQRVPIPRRKWVIANIGPALVGWLLVIMPAVISAQNSHKSVSTAYLLAASQTLALGPLLGLSQALVLRKVTRRWAWWIAANLLSWLIANAVIYLLSHAFGGLNAFSGHGSIAEVYLTLVATTPLTGRALLWVLAPPALTAPAQPPPSASGQAPQARPA